jgi:hypothetical protein
VAVALELEFQMSFRISLTSYSHHTQYTRLDRHWTKPTKLDDDNGNEAIADQTARGVTGPPTYAFHKRYVEDVLISYRKTMAQTEVVKKFKKDKKMKLTGGGSPDFPNSI